MAPFDCTLNLLLQHNFKFRYIKRYPLKKIDKINNLEFISALKIQCSFVCC